jgi:DNA processing protein
VTAPGAALGPGSVAPTAEVDLPARAFAAALAGLPGMGPARLAAILRAAPPAEAWGRVGAGHVWTEGDVVRGLGPGAAKLVAAWRERAGSVDVGEGWRRLAELGVSVTVLGDDAYPEVLAVDVEPPAVLFHEGDLGALAGPRVAIVGTRRCSTTGRGVAFELGRDLAAAGVSVVSGLAAGIDGAAHRGVLDARSAPPIGVVGSGHDVVYPPHQGELWRAVASAGLLLSEAPPGARPERWRFPARNRIIAALADLVVVVESHARGGSLHTVDESDRRARDVFAVPGSVRNPAAAGTNALLAEGRAPVCSVDDLLVALDLGRGRGQRSTDRRPPPDPADREVLDGLGWEPATLDQLAARTGLDLVRLAPALDRLHDTGWVEREGGWYQQVADRGGRS